MKELIRILLSVSVAMSLLACGDKGGNSNGAAAAPPVEEEEEVETSSINCYWSWSKKAYIDSSGNSCTPTSADLYSSHYCHNYIYNQTTGQWVDNNGAAVSCTIGYVDFNNFMPYYIITQYGYRTSCSYYGYGWRAMQFGYAMICVKQSYFQTYFPTYGSYGYYGNNYGYYGYGNNYNYGSNYPRSCRWGVDCHRCQGVSAGGNLGTLWFGGTLGLCY